LSLSLYRLADQLRRPRINTGERGEDIAHRWLRSRGFTVVARNWRPPEGGGELDIVAWERDELVFVEVKARLSNLSAPERAIDPDKIRALRRAARAYVRRALPHGAEPQESNEETRIRFDVVTIFGNEVDHLRDAFPF